MTFISSILFSFSSYIFLNPESRVANLSKMFLWNIVLSEMDEVLSEMDQL